MEQIIEEIINNQEISLLIDRVNIINEDIDEFLFNIFNLSRYGSHLEEFHSDILFQLFEPEGLHNEGEVPLNYFISFLNDKHFAEINPNWFQNSKVNREDGRIDISILDSLSKKAILIENKINGAEDRDNQLDNYYKYLVKEGYDVCCIIYLTLSGEKNAPLLKSTNIKPINLKAFSNEVIDLVNGWINPLISNCKTLDTISLLNQYKKLLIYLGYNSMQDKELKAFYALSDDMTLLEKIDSLKELSQRVPKYRTDQLVKNIADFRPFEKSYRYKDWHMLYEKYKEGKNSFKIDIWFEENGDAFLHFWNPGKSGDIKSIEKKLEEISFLDEMEKDMDWVGYSKVFDFSEYGSLSKLDNALLKFTQDLMKALASTVK